MVSTQCSDCHTSLRQFFKEIARWPGLMASFALILSVNGCASLETQSQSTEPGGIDSVSVILPDVEPEKVTREPPPPAPGAIPSPILTDLLTAEFAGQRQRYDIAVKHYLNAARQSDADEITSRAARVARFAGNTQSTREAAELWLKTNPDEPEAHQLMAQSALANGQFDTAVHHMMEIRRLTGRSQFEYLSTRIAHMTKEQKQALIQALRKQEQTLPHDPSLLTTQGVMHQSLGRVAPALEKFEQALDIDPDYRVPAVMKARLLAAIKRHDEALEWLDEVLGTHPDHKGMRELRAKVLLRLDRMQDALDAYGDLHARYPADSEIRFTLALLSYERKMPYRAKGLLVPLLNDEQLGDRANYYLGLILIDLDEPEEAIRYFSQVQPGDEFLPASSEALRLITARESFEAGSIFLKQQANRSPEDSADLTGLLADLLAETSQLEAALDTYQQGLTIEPDNTHLLYGRAMVYARQDNIVEMEQDLSRVIELEPNNAEALNALGYTLADKTTRTQEALALIRRAFVLAPHSAAISDSLGWAYFRLGNMEQAEKYLKRAYDKMHDHEIAAHYGELLWITDRQSKAVQVWKRALKETPDSNIIKDTLDRLQIQLK